MSERGYLWDDLAAEVVGEFSELVMFDGLWGSAYSFAPNLGEKPRNPNPMTNVERAAKTVARRVNEGKCRRCENIPVPGKKCCAKHLEYQAEYKRRRVAAMREKLSTTRDGMTLHFTITSRAPGHKQGPSAGIELIEVDGYVTTGVYEDGRLGEFFVRVGKGAEEFGPAIDCWAEAASVALQYGAPVDVVLNKPVARRDSISGPVTGVKGITRCTSPYDLIARWLLMKYGSPEMQERIAKSSGEVQP